MPKKLTPQQTVNVLVDAGWPPKHLYNAFRTVFFESSFRPDVTSEDDQVANKPRTASYGLFQINPIFWSEEIKQFLRDEGLLENVDPDFTEPEYYYDKYKPEEEQGDVHKRVPVLSKREIELIMDPVLNAQFAFEHIFARHGWDGSGPDGTNVNAQGEPLMNSAWTSIATWINSLKFPGYDGKDNEYRDIRIREEEVGPIWESTEGPTIVEESGSLDNETSIGFQGLEGKQDETGTASLGKSRFLGDRDMVQSPEGGILDMSSPRPNIPRYPTGQEFGSPMGAFDETDSMTNFNWKDDALRSWLDQYYPNQGGIGNAELDFDPTGGAPPDTEGALVSNFEPAFMKQNMV